MKTLIGTDVLARIEVMADRVLVSTQDPVRFTEMHVTTTVASVANAFADIPISTGVLPERCVFLSLKDGDSYLAVWHPPHRRTLKTVQRSYDVPLPAMMLVGHKTSIWMYALKNDKFPIATDELYIPPIMNVSGMGMICRGDNKWRVTEGGVWKIWDELWASVFTFHLQVKLGGKLITDFWAELETADSFPKDVLKLCCPQKTVGNLVL